MDSNKNEELVLMISQVMFEIPCITPKNHTAYGIVLTEADSEDAEDLSPHVICLPSDSELKNYVHPDRLIKFSPKGEVLKIW